MKITVTAGHGAGDPGNTWGGYNEADLMLSLRDITAAKLSSLGHTVLTDGDKGQNDPLRQAIALVSGSKVALELHTNASSNTSASGVEIVAPIQHRLLSQRLAGAISSVLEIPVRRDRGWYDPELFKKDRGFYPGFSQRGGLIVEAFFQSNPQDLAAFLAREWVVASAIVEVITKG